MSDDLFRPTLSATARDPSLPRPWRVGSQIYVAFFGGCFSILAIAALNLYRLGGDLKTLGPLMVGLTLVVWGGVSGAAAALLGHSTAETSRTLRLAYRIGAVVLHLVFARLQAPLERRYLATGGEPASLWVPGLAAVFGGAIVQFALTLAVVLPFLALED